VLCFIARPKSELDMKNWLGQSVWDAKTYIKFKYNHGYIQTYIDNYPLSWMHYKDQLYFLLEIFDHPETRTWFPYCVTKKGTIFGLLDYSFNGTLAGLPQEHTIAEVRQKFTNF